MENKILLFNPVGLVHDRNISIFNESLPGWNIRRIYNSASPLFSNRKVAGGDVFFFRNGRVPRYALEDVKAVILFSAQPRIPPCMLIQEAAFRAIPVIAIEEVYQMMLEQGYVNEYFLPVDHLFAGSTYERDRFIEIGVPKDVVEATGCIFRYKRSLRTDPVERGTTKKRLSLSSDKHVATLSLAYLTPSGETKEIRKNLLTLVSKGLPQGYELVVKPHPAEADKEIAVFIQRYAPRAKVIDKHTSIDEILDITDVLFNRGNSQVIIKALERGIPVVAVPLGRRTLCHGLLDEVAVDEPEEIPEVMRLIGERGMLLYKDVFSRYQLISPEESLHRTISRIEEIAEDNTLYNPAERLTELALFWAFMGYVQQSLRILRTLKNISEIKHLPIERISRLILNKADAEDLAFLKRWAPYGYKQWIVQSLWIKSIYITGNKISNEDKKWLGAYPPRMNREYFIPFACMLCWSYIRNGSRAEGELILDRFYNEYSFLDDVRILKKCIDHADTFYCDTGYLRTRSRYVAKAALKNFGFEFGR